MVLRRTLESAKFLKSQGCVRTGTRPPYKEHTPFPWHEGGSRGSNCAHGRRHGTTGSQLRQVWKNTGSAVETEPHGETSAIGNEKRRNINGLARAALERERELRAYRAEIVDHWRFQGVHAGK